MSIRYAGRASRSFIMGMRLCPPLRIFASSPCCSSRAIASGIVVGLRYSKAGGIIASPSSQVRSCTLKAAVGSMVQKRSVLSYHTANPSIVSLARLQRRRTVFVQPRPPVLYRQPDGFWSQIAASHFVFRDATQGVGHRLLRYL